MKIDSFELNTQAANRTVYFDYLRVFATFAVIILHISASNWHTTDVNGFEWQVFNFFDSITRWCVPIFIMISGSLFLNRNIPLKTMYSKYLLRMASAFVGWSAVYAAFMEGSLTDKLIAFLQGHYHMWFILMIAGIYICIPFIKPIVETDLRIKYFLALSLIFAFVFPELFMLAKDFGNDLIIQGSKAIKTDVKNMNMHIVLGYVSYFVLGYYFDKIKLGKNQRIIIYVLGLAGFIFTVVVDLAVALKTQTACGRYYGNFNVNILLETLAVFTFFKYGKYESDKLNAIVLKMSKYSFGAYLVHALIIEQLNIRLGLNTLSFNPVLAVPSIGVIVFAVSFTISALLNRIPVVKKYLV